jgi:hypothetical protein
MTHPLRFALVSAAFLAAMPALAWEPAIVGLDETGNGHRITSVGALDATGAVTPEMVGSRGDEQQALELALGVTDPTGAVMPEVVAPAPARPSGPQVAARPADTTGSNATDRLACTCHHR